MASARGAGLWFRLPRVILGAGFSTLRLGDRALPLSGRLFLKPIALPVISPWQPVG